MAACVGRPVAFGRTPTGRPASCRAPCPGAGGLRRPPLGAGGCAGAALGPPPPAEPRGGTASRALAARAA
eukprot:3659391-Lingulodinium_polyedra.AAC.1